MIEYVRGSDYDKWHWCKNCTQYPIYVYQKTPVKPVWGFCEQCKTKEENEDCQCGELKRTTPKPQLKRELSDFGQTIL